jgi:hypothetical protein
MNNFLELVLAGILSGAVISTVLSTILYRRTASIAEDIKNEYARSLAVFTSTRAWKEKSVSELLGPLYIQFDRTSRAFSRWQSKNLFLEAKVIKEGNLTIRDLLLSKSYLIPPALLEDASTLIEHYDRWLEEFERIRNDQNPDLDTPFVFVGTKGFPFPIDAETNFRKAFTEMWRELYG